MKAGTLEIELLTNVAKLQADMEQVKKAVGGMTDDVARKTRAANDNIALVGNTGRLAAHHTQNLAFQFQDLGVQMVMAAQSSKPLQMALMALMQQGAQIQGIMSQAGIGVGGLAKELGRMAARWAPLAAAVGVGALAINSYTDSVNEAANNDDFIRSLGLTEKEMKKLEGTAVSAGDVMLGTWDVVSGAIYNQLEPAIESISPVVDDVFSWMKSAAKDGVNTMVALNVGGARAAIAAWGTFAPAVADLFAQAVNWAIRHINQLIQASVNGINAFLETVNDKVGTSFGPLSAPQIAEIENSYKGAAERSATAVKDAFQSAFGEDYVGEFGDAVTDASIKRFQQRMRNQAAEIIDDRSAGRTRKPGKSEAEREMERLIKEAERFAEALEEEAARIGKTTIEIKRMEVAAAAAAAPTAALRNRILEAGEAWERAFRAQADADFLKNVIRPLEQELALLALTGPARDKAALAMEEESFKAKALEDGISDVNAAWEEYLRLHTAIIDAGSMLEREREQAELLKRELDRIIGAIGGQGRIGGFIGALLGITTGRIDAIGGPLGDILQTQTGWMKDENGREMARTFGHELRDIFKLDGEFGKTMSSLLQGAGNGLVIGNALFGNQSQAEQIGSALGGALGQAAGTAIGGPIGGAIGNVLGSVLGHFAGGLIGGTPKGGATIGGAGDSLGIVGTSGGSSSRIAAASQNATAIIEGLNQLAAQLGATIDPSRGRVSIGMYNNNWRVSTTGSSRFGGYSGSESENASRYGLYNFGQDAEAAARFAMQDLIRDGVLVGLREGTNRLLRNAQDIEAGLAKALDFEQVFRDLAAIKDPVGSALDALDKEFERLRKIFQEAGASTAEYAQLEELYQHRRQEAVENATRQLLDELRPRRELEIQILDLLGRKEDALAASRELELAGLEASLRPLQQTIYQLQDARDIMAQFEPLAADLRAFREELTGGAGGALGLGAARARFFATADLAAGGDAAAMGRIRSEASTYLDAARENAATALDYQRAFGAVLGAVDESIFVADTKVDMAQAQIDAIAAQTDILASMSDRLEALQTQANDMAAQQLQLLRRWNGDGLPIRAFEDTPLQVEVVD